MHHIGAPVVQWCLIGLIIFTGQRIGVPVEWVIYYPRVFPGWNKRCVTAQAALSTGTPQPRLASRRVPRSPGWLLDGFPVSPSLTFSHLASNAPFYSRRPLAEMGDTQ